MQNLILSPLTQKAAGAAALSSTTADPVLAGGAGSGADDFLAILSQLETGVPKPDAPGPVPADMPEGRKIKPTKGETEAEDVTVRSEDPDPAAVLPVLLPAEIVAQADGAVALNPAAAPGDRLVGQSGAVAAKPAALVLDGAVGVEAVPVSEPEGAPTEVAAPSRPRAGSGAPDRGRPTDDLPAAAGWRVPQDLPVAESFGPVPGQAAADRDAAKGTLAKSAAVDGRDGAVDAVVAGEVQPPVNAAVVAGDASHAVTDRVAITPTAPGAETAPAEMSERKAQEASALEVPEAVGESVTGAEAGPAIPAGPPDARRARMTVDSGTAGRVPRETRVTERQTEAVPDLPGPEDAPVARRPAEGAAPRAEARPAPRVAGLAGAETGAEWRIRSLGRDPAVEAPNQVAPNAEVGADVPSAPVDAPEGVVSARVALPQTDTRNVGARDPEAPPDLPATMSDAPPPREIVAREIPAVVAIDRTQRTKLVEVGGEHAADPAPGGAAPFHASDPAAPHAAHVRRAEQPVAAPVVAQVVETVRVAQTGTTELRLSPEELGAVRIDLRSDGDRVSVVIAAERPDTLDLMRRHADRLAGDLRAAGFSQLDLSFGRWSGEGQRQQAPNPQPLPAAPDPVPTAARLAPAPAIPLPSALGASGLYLRI